SSISGISAASTGSATMSGLSSLMSSSASIALLPGGLPAVSVEFSVQLVPPAAVQSGAVALSTLSAQFQLDVEENIAGYFDVQAMAVVAPFVLTLGCSFNSQTNGSVTVTLLLLGNVTAVVGVNSSALEVTGALQALVSSSRFVTPNSN